MTTHKLTKLAMVGAVALALGFPITNAQAQTTETVTASVTVANGFTVSVTNGLLFGTVGFFLDGTNDVEYALSTADGETFTPAGGTSSMVSIVGGEAAEVAVQGPIAADIDMVITATGITNPTDGNTAFVLDSFFYNDQSDTPNSGPITLDSPVTVTLDAANADEDVLIGASLTADGTAEYEDGLYTGSFEVTFQY